MSETVPKPMSQSQTGMGAAAAGDWKQEQSCDGSSGVS